MKSKNRTKIIIIKIWGILEKKKTDYLSLWIISKLCDWLQFPMNQKILQFSLHRFNIEKFHFIRKLMMMKNSPNPSQVAENNINWFIENVFKSIISFALLQCWNDFIWFWNGEWWMETYINTLQTNKQFLFAMNMNCDWFAIYSRVIKFKKIKIIARNRFVIRWIFSSFFLCMCVFIWS